MKKKIIVSMMGVWLAGLVLFGAGLVSRADDDIDTLKERIGEKQDELGGLQQEKRALQSGRTSVQQTINSLESKKNEMSAYVAALDAEVETIQANIDALNLQIADKEAEIEVTRAELQVAEETANEQYEAMKERICFMYERGDTLYMEMLLSAESFGDMLNKADYIQMLSDYDRKKLEEYRLVVEEVNVTKQVLEEEEEILEAAKEAAQKEQDDLNTLIAEKEAQIKAYEADIATQEKAIQEYDAEIAAQNQLIKDVEAAIAADKAALAEAQRLHYNGGKFAWPAPKYTRISDSFGWRMHPTLHVQKFHNGVDLAAPGGSPILAAYDGKVVAAGYSSSMGNYIMIDHGDNLMTVYMHASALYVSKGATVTRGQKIAAVGSTGRSTGNHLHFGVRKNGEYVDPMPYIK
ncbi:MAG: peptidoglycan DD-metalloendopeptidase family protein [Lachnospiraceae bacterium]|nr:peptidoglycan DD-metalloendopeptidase family protein [Lachnospiraceae bacterium]